MIMLLVLAGLLVLAVQRYARSNYELRARRQVLAIRWATVLITLGAVILWQAWDGYAPATFKISLFVTVAIIGFGYGLGEWTVRRRLARAGVPLKEGVRGPLY